MKENRWRINSAIGVYGGGTPSKGVYTDLQELLGDFEQCCFLQPENKYYIEKYDDDNDCWERVYSNMSSRDFIFCEDCRQFVDFYKYDAIDDTGHSDCNWRFVTTEELKECVRNCLESGCCGGV